MKRKLVVVGAVWIVVPWTIQIVIERRRRKRERPEGTTEREG